MSMLDRITRLFKGERKVNRAEAEQEVCQKEEEWEVCRKEVIHCFLTADFTKEKTNYGDLRQLMKMSLPDLEAKLNKQPSFLDGPFGEWTSCSEKRGDEIDSWIFRKGVSLKDCWTAGINKSLKIAEMKVKGNIVRLSEHPAAVTEFNDKMPPAYKQTLIGVLRKESDKEGGVPVSEKDGNVQIIDGAHRLVAMWRNGIQKANMYLGKQKKDDF